MELEIDLLFQLFWRFNFDDFILSFDRGLNKVKSHFETFFHKFALIIRKIELIHFSLRWAVGVSQIIVISFDECRIKLNKNWFEIV